MEVQHFDSSYFKSVESKNIVRPRVVMKVLSSRSQFIIDTPILLFVQNKSLWNSPKRLRRLHILRIRSVSHFIWIGTGELSEDNYSVAATFETKWKLILGSKCAGHA
jgi:hypothetical protein